MMKKNNLILYIFSVFLLFIIPLSIIYKNYDLLINGQVYFFKVDPFNPNDIFRDSYLNVYFEEDFVNSNKLKSNNESDNYYVEIKTRSDGFSYFDNITKKEPKNKNYYKTQGYYYEYKNGYIIDTPMRYYVNEKVINDYLKEYDDKVENAYVKVRVKNGNMIITGVYVNNKPIESYK